MNCPSALIMGGLTISLVVIDISYSQANRSMFHLFFGSVITVLLFLLCQYGYERVNWILLALAFLFIISSMVFMQLTPKDGCEKPKPNCEKPKPNCEKPRCSVCKTPKPNCRCNGRYLKTHH